jgi:hypothetical protein
MITDYRQTNVNRTSINDIIDGFMSKTRNLIVQVSFITFGTFFPAGIFCWQHFRDCKFFILFTILGFSNFYTFTKENGADESKDTLQYKV